MLWIACAIWRRAQKSHWRLWRILVGWLSSGIWRGWNHCVNVQVCCNLCDRVGFLPVLTAPCYTFIFFSRIMVPRFRTAPCVAVQACHVVRIFLRYVYVGAAFTFLVVSLPEQVTCARMANVTYVCRAHSISAHLNGLLPANIVVTISVREAAGVVRAVGLNVYSMLLPG